MATVRWNIFANFLGGAWAAVLTLVIIPVQIKILGMEAFALVGLIATLQIVFNVLDLGLSATINRSVASDVSNNHEHSREIIQTAATLYWGIALVIGGVLGSQAGWVADNWFKLEKLSPATVRLGIQIIALSLALRWPVALYAGVISGLQRLEILNLLKSAVITVRLLGGVLIVLVFRDLTIFLIWIGVSAAIEIVSYVTVCCRLMPQLSLRPFFSLSAVKEVWQFSLGMNLIAVLAMVLTQTDRIMISKLMTMEMLGFYFLAYNTAIGIVLIQGAINTAMFPSYASDYGIASDGVLTSRHNKATQITVYLVALPAFALIFFGHDILSVWVSPVAADGAYLALGILAFGSLLNAAVSNCYTIATASGHPYMVMKANILGVLLYVPGLYWLILSHGILGAALAWVFLNFYYLVSVLPMVQKSILNQSAIQWLRGNLLPFMGLGLVTFGGVRLLLSFYGGDQLVMVLTAFTVSTVIYAFAGYLLLNPSLKTDIGIFLRQIIRGASIRSVN
ncbi:MAG: oligosaccharide flippase family protein [Deltaproteobacteria bacterium]|nr:oligosaccharide flippase family protein [Deltaproteobacteria bacterium]MBW2114150.1 oligosaccharide flippase family protein [Deltaproteobacteria bacterium]MBW2357227.1 oligosaccharide flippase family protein [Deltaproteobacteria bacterium]